MHTRHPLRTAIAALAALGLPAAAMGESQDAAAPPPAAPSASPPQTMLPSLAESASEVLTLEEDRHERLTVPVLVEGAGPYDFMIDTGSQATAVTHGISTSLGLKPFGTATLVGMASRRPVEMVEVGQLDFGRQRIENLVAPVLDAAHVGADGIIGLDSLQDYRVLIDFRRQTIAVEEASDRQRSGGFEIIVRARRRLGQLLITDAMVEGVRATVIIDTGAQASLGNLALRERIRTQRATEVTAIDVNGVELTGQLSYVRSLSIEGLSLTNVPLTFADAPAFEALGLKDQPVLSLGMQHLALFDRVAIDFASKRVLFDLPHDIARALRNARRAGSNQYRF